MAAGPGPYPSPGEITSEAKKVVEAAVKVRGEVELRYVPLDWPHRSSIAGREWSQYDNPMSYSGPYGAFAIGPDKRYLGTDADYAKLRSEFSFVTDVFADRIDPDPARFQPLIDGMEQTALTIRDDPDHTASSPVAQYIRDASGEIDKWKGPAANTFRANFMNKLEVAAQNQAYIAGAMMHAMIAERDTYVYARNDLLNTANQSVSAIEASHNKDTGGLKAVLTVAAAVTGLAAGIASIPTTGGLLVPAEIQATLWIISGASATMGLPLKEKDKGNKLSAGSVYGVLNNMMDAIIRLDQYIGSHETDVIKSLDSCYQTLIGPMRDTHIVPPEPAMVHESDTQIRTDFLPP
jgi:hypothetical protein